MADGSTIEWLARPGTKPASWNPVRGCSRVSRGCGGPGDEGGCYAEVMAARFSKPGMWGHGIAEMVTKPDGTKDHRWTGNVTTHDDVLLQPLSWKNPRTVFVTSTSDLFHEKVPDEFIDKVFAVMALCPQHTFLNLTKRPERMQAYFATTGQPDKDCTRKTDVTAETFTLNGTLSEGRPEYLFTDADCLLNDRWPLPNVWLGISCEDQATADERIPLLLQTPAAIRFVSYEPALGPIDLENFLWGPWKNSNSKPVLRNSIQSRLAESLDWIICGGESGPGARPMHPDWARSVRDQCKTTGAAFFFKQWGAWLISEATGEPEWRHKFQDGSDFANLSDGADIMLDAACTHRGAPEHLWRDYWATGDGQFAKKLGKKTAGRLLDGREHNEWPSVPSAASARIPATTEEAHA